MLIKYKKSFNIQNIKDMAKSIISEKILPSLRDGFLAFPEKYFNGEYFSIYVYNPKESNSRKLVFIKVSNEKKCMDLIKNYVALNKEYSSANEEDLEYYQDQLESIFDSIEKLTDFIGSLNSDSIKFLSKNHIEPIESYYK